MFTSLILLLAIGQTPAPPPVVVSPWVTKSGTLIAFGVSSTAAPAVAGAAPTPAPISAVNAQPTVYVNGQAVASGPVVGTYQSNRDLPIVFARLNCGAVRTLAVAAGGSGYTAPRVKWNGDGGGSGIVCGKPTVVGGAIQWVPIVYCSPDFESPPTFTVTDPAAAATGASLTPIMTGVSPGDIVTYDAPANWISPVLGGNEGGGKWNGGTVQPVTAVTGAPVDNWTGRLEGVSGGFGCFAQTPKLTPGVNVAAQPSAPGYPRQTTKNRLTAGQWQCSGGTLTLDAGGTPVSWTNPAAAVVRNWCHGPLGTGPLGDSFPGFPGQWTVRYEDPGAGTASAATVALTARYGPRLVSSTTAGRVVTQVWSVAYPDNPPSLELDVAVTVRMPAGPDGLGHWTIRKLMAVPPDARSGLAQPIGDADDNFTPDPNALRAFAGAGVARWMDATGNYGGGRTQVEPSDFRDPGAGVWQGAPTLGCQFVAARRFNTDPGNAAYAWSSPKILGPQALFAGGGFALPPDDSGRFMGTSDGLAIELRSAAPHPFRTGQMVTFWCPADGVPVPVGAADKALAGTTFAPTPGVASGQVFVTGPTTLAVVLYNPIGLPWADAPQVVAGTAEIDLTAGGTKPGWTGFINANFGSPGASVPYRYTAAFAAGLPGSTLWCNLPPMASDGLAAWIAAEIAREIGPGNRIYLELSNEVWNGSLGNAGLFTSMARLLGYVQPGTTVLGDYAGTGKRPPANQYGAYVPIAGHLYDAFTRAAAAAGISPSRVETVYGSFWPGYGVTGQIAALAKTSNLRVDHVAVAPYLNTPADPTIVAAFSPAGSSPSAGAWPVEAINDLHRHYAAYSAVLQSYWRGHAAALAGTRTTIVCYEGGADWIVPPGVPQRKALQVDCFAHPSARDVVWAWYAACQQGDPTTPGSGATAACWYQGLGGAPEWYLCSGLNQVPGLGRRDGSGNLYATYQGGYPADGHEHAGGNLPNASPALQGLQDWGAAAGVIPVPVVPAINLAP